MIGEWPEVRLVTICSILGQMMTSRRNICQKRWRPGSIAPRPGYWFFAQKPGQTYRLRCRFSQQEWDNLTRMTRREASSVTSLTCWGEWMVCAEYTGTQRIILVSWCPLERVQSWMCHANTSSMWLAQRSRSWWVSKMSWARWCGAHTSWECSGTRSTITFCVRTASQPIYLLRTDTCQPVRRADTFIAGFLDHGQDREGGCYCGTSRNRGDVGRWQFQAPAGGRVSIV